nr:hypothetical protein [uncultured archaeon]
MKNMDTRECDAEGCGEPAEWFVPRRGHFCEECVELRK